MSKRATLANCIAKMYDGGKLDNSGTPTGTVKKSPSTTGLLTTLGGVEIRLMQLEGRVEQIASTQAEVLRRLDVVCQGLDSLEKDVTQIRRSQEREGEVQNGDGLRTASPCAGGGEAALLSEVKGLCGEMVTLLGNLQQEGKRQRERLDGIEGSMSTLDRVMGYLGEVFRSSKVVEFILKGVVPWRIKGLLGNDTPPDQKRDCAEDGSPAPKPTVCHRGTQVEEEGSEPAEDTKQIPEEVKQADPEAPSPVSPPESPTCPSPSSSSVQQEEAPPLLTRDGSTKGSRRPKEVTMKSREPTRVQTFVPENQEDTAAQTTAPVLDRPESAAEVVADADTMEIGRPDSSTTITEEPKSEVNHETISPPAKEQKTLSALTEPQVSQSQSETTGVVKTQLETEVIHLQSVQEDSAQQCSIQPDLNSSPGAITDGAEPTTTAPASSGSRQNAASASQFAVIDDCPPAPAPFEHRIVSAKQVPMGSYYSVKPNEILGGGRFGQVHKCAELSSGLTLAAKIIKVRGMKERDEVKNEIGVMNQLNHVNLIQLYDAFESRTNLTLIMEYVEGGELFDRIVDENYQLTELDAIIFTKQICEGVQYLHQQYILHLDLKPENILCVSSTGNQIKIIDFGLARKYRPREKLKVNFGTPEFLAPEVVNYDFVSFPTDMWSVGVITYMLLSGLSPFLGDNDAETMNNILHANWDFDSEAFENVSNEAKDFISRLLIPVKSGRLSASGCMKHSWLNNLEDKAKVYRVKLKSQVKLQSYLAAHRQWKKHFYVVAAANRLKRFRQNRSINTV
ncbi:myosin light chain kinase 3 [Myripristis murdjan]|uniref:myosin light chain kinase 3 n=1 Tax=Myripristis murdjan TaxID=586833 RepID=UPI00117626B6|nr:myosin light chain kinase 3 [Myripristis murdjan]